MIVRNNKGVLVILNRNMYIRDDEYYMDICKHMGVFFPKDFNELERICALVLSDS